MEDKKSYMQKMADQLKEYDDKMEIEEIKKGPVPQVKTDENANTSPTNNRNQEYGIDKCRQM